MGPKPFYCIWFFWEFVACNRILGLILLKNISISLFSNESYRHIVWFSKLQCQEYAKTMKNTFLGLNRLWAQSCFTVYLGCWLIYFPCNIFLTQYQGQKSSVSSLHSDCDKICFTLHVTCDIHRSSLVNAYCFS